MKCVCKSWKTLFSDPIFVKMHHKRQSTRMTHLALFSKHFQGSVDCRVVPISHLLDTTSNSITLTDDDNRVKRIKNTNKIWWLESKGYVESLVSTSWKYVLFDNILVWNFFSLCIVHNELYDYLHIMVWFGWLYCSELWLLAAMHFFNFIYYPNWALCMVLWYKSLYAHAIINSSIASILQLSWTNWIHIHIVIIFIWWFWFDYIVEQLSFWVYLDSLASLTTFVVAK